MSEAINPSDSSATSLVPSEVQVEQGSELAPSPVVANIARPTKPAPKPVPAPVVVATIPCAACGAPLPDTTEDINRGGVTFRECLHCGSFTALDPKPIAPPVPSEYLVKQYLFDKNEEPVLIWGSEDGSFVSFLTEAGYKASGYDARFSSQSKLPQGKFATIIICDVLNFSADVSETLIEAKALLADGGKIVVQNYFRSNRNAEQLSIAADVKVELGAKSILTNQGLALAAKRAGLNVISQDFARAIIFA